MWIAEYAYPVEFQVQVWWVLQVLEGLRPQRVK